MFTLYRFMMNLLNRHLLMYLVHRRKIRCSNGDTIVVNWVDEDTFTCSLYSRLGHVRSTHKVVPARAGYKLTYGDRMDILANHGEKEVREEHQAAEQAATTVEEKWKILY